MKRSLTLLLLVTLVTEGEAGPVLQVSQSDEILCARQCKGTSKFNYVPGTTYQFEYNVQTQTAMEGASSEKAALGIRATADIEVLSKCDLALKLRNVKVFRSDPSSSKPLVNADVSGKFKKNLERFPLRFSFQDGVVEELCPSDSESTWALNIKRGLLSTIQNSMTNLNSDETIRERDITGECSTDYKVADRGWFSTTIKKTKDLLGCTDRNGYRSSVHAMPYRVPSEIQSLPLMKSIHECEQELDRNGLLKSALIRETHTFRPFSQASSGATTKIIQRLTYKTQRSGITATQGYVQKRIGLEFEHSSGFKDQRSIIKDAENKLRNLCHDTQSDIRPETTSLFAELIFHIKHLDLKDLRYLYRQLKQGVICSNNSVRVKKFFFDAIPMVSTSSSVQFMKKILLNRDVTGTQATMWITSLSFIDAPNLDMLLAVKDLLVSPQYSKMVILPVSTMINNYCNHHESCTEEHAVTSIMSTMESIIGNGCYVRDLDSTLLALRALGNAGHLTSMTSILSSCFSRQSNPIEVRVTAIQAYRRLPCTVDKRELMNVYRDGSEDSELRIAAYLVVMACPTDDILSTIQQTLEVEKSDQVGSFVWSHLTNLMESSSPHMQNIRQIIKDKRLYRPFDLNRFKYSRNYEGSVFWEAVNMGGKVDANSIFSEKASIPRSLTLNMTVDLFGNSLNLLELGGRVEGLEYLIQTYFGENNYFRSWVKGKTKARANLNSLRGSVYMRMFGNELYYDHVKGTDPVASVKQFNFLDLLIRMSNNNDYSFTQSVMILDSSMVIPTSSGMPLNLTVNGTATIDLQASGQVDLRKLATSPSSMLIGGIIKPSAAIQIAGTMNMDAFVTKSGLRVVNTWHSNTVLQGKVELKRGKIFSVNLDFPQKKIELLDVSTTFFSIHGDQERKQDLLTDNRKTLELCTGSRLATITGLELCNEFQWTNASLKTDAPYFPFTGPFSQSIILYKRDTHTGYTIMAKRSMTKGTASAQITLDTPGSRTDRNLDLSFVFIDKARDKHIDVTLVSPWTKAKLKGSAYYNKKKIGMKGNMVIDKTSEYSITTEAGIQKKGDRVTYFPWIQVKRPGVKDILLTGEVMAKSFMKANVDLSLTGVKSNAITLKAAMLNTKQEKNLKGTFSLGPGQNYSTEVGLMMQEIKRRNSKLIITPTLRIKTPKTELLSVAGSITSSEVYKKRNSLDGKLSVDIHRLIKKPIILECNLNMNTGRQTKYSGTMKVNSDFLVTNLKGGVHKKKGTIRSTLTLDYNLPMTKVIMPDKISLKSKYNDRSTKARWNYKMNLHFTDKRRPHLNLQTEADFSHTKRETEIDVNLKYGKKTRSLSHQVVVYTLINHEVTRDSVNVDYNMRLGIGPADLATNLEGEYTQHHHSVTSVTSLTYGSNAQQDMKRMSADIQINRHGSLQRGNFETTIKLQTPFQGYQNLTAHAECNIDAGKISSLGRVSWNKGKDVTLEVDLRMPDIIRNWRKGFTRLSFIELESSLKTPFSGFEMTSLKYHHSINETQAQSKVVVRYRNGKLITSDMTVILSPSVYINVDLEAPFKKFKKNWIVLRHAGPWTNFQSHLDVNLIGYTATGDSSLKYDGSVNAMISATSNINSVERVSARFNYVFNKSQFIVDIAGILQNATFEATSSVTSISGHIDGSLSLRTPFKNFIENHLQFQCTRPWYRNSSASLKYNNGKLISWRVTELRRDGNYRTRSMMELKTPFKNFEIYSVEVKENLFRRNHSNFINFTVIYGSGSKISFDTVLKEKREFFNISFIVQTPFPKYEYNKLVVGGKGKRDNFTGYMDIKFSETIIHVFTGFYDRWEKNGILDIRTNIPNYENISGTFNICSKGNFNATSRLTVNEETVQTELLMFHDDGTILGLTITTPFINYRNIRWFINHIKINGTKVEVCKWSIVYMDGKEIVANFTYFSPKRLKAEMVTPFEGYEYQAIEIINDRRRCCNGHVGVKVVHSGNKTMETDLLYVLEPILDIKLTFYAENDGGRIHIKNVLNNSIPVNTEFLTEVRLPYKGYEKQLISYKHSFDEGNLDGKLDVVNIEGTDISAVVSGIYKPNVVKGELNVATNVDGFEHSKVKFSKDDDLNKLRISGGITATIFGLETFVDHLQTGENQYINGTFSLRRGRLVSVKVVGQKVGKNINSDLFVTWDGDKPNSNIRVLTTLTDSSRYSNTDVQMKTRIIRPSQSLAVVGSLLCTRQRTKSHGEFIWDEDAGQKIFYDFDLKDRSKIYDGTVKLGSPVRNIKMDGSYSDTGVTRTVDGSFNWDADRDNTKEVGVKAVLTPGDRNKKADFMLRLPAVGKDIIVVSEMTRNDGTSLFSWKTKLSYSKDPQKTVIVTTRLDDISRGYRSTNYSLGLGISHPYTDTDVQLTSHVGSSRKKYTGGLDLVYLTSWKKRKTFALRGEVSKDMSRAGVVVISPIKNMDLAGEVTRNPYKLKIWNKGDNGMVQADITTDTQERMVDITTTYDFDDPGKSLHMIARYLNSSNVQASAYHKNHLNLVLDGFINFRLNASRLIHTRLSWRPDQVIADIQAFLATRVDQYGEAAKCVIHTVYDGVGDELSGKYNSITQAVSEEAKPYLIFLETEMSIIQRHLDSIRRDIRRAYRQHDLVVKYAGEYLDQANKLLKKVVTSVTTTFSNVKKKLTKKLTKMKIFPIRERYDNLMSELVDRLQRSVDKAVTEAKKAISRLDDQLLAAEQITRQHYLSLRNTAIDSIEKVVDLPRIVDNNLQISNSISPYVDRLHANTLQTYGSLKTVVQRSGEGITNYIVDSEQRDDLQLLYTLTNEIHQGGVSAYSQWKTEDKPQKYLQDYRSYLQKKAENYLKDRLFYYRPKITVWDPEHGQIQVEFYLPIPLKSLDTLPDVPPSVQRARAVVSNYIPDKTTINKYYKYFPTSMWQTNKTA